MAPAPQAAGHWELLEHTADVRLRLRASDAAGIYRVAVTALQSLIRDRADAGGSEDAPGEAAEEGHHEQMVELEGIDPADLLVQLLNEALFLLERGDGLAVAISPRSVTETRLSGTLRPRSRII